MHTEIEERILEINKDEVIKKLENVTVSEFLKTDNNGMIVTKNYFIYNAGGVIIIKREAQ